MSSKDELKKLTEKYGSDVIQNDLNELITNYKREQKLEQLTRLISKIKETYDRMDLEGELSLFLEKWEFFSQFGNMDTLYEINSIIEEED